MKESITNTSQFRIYFWLLVLVVFILQLVVTLKSTNQIRLEELNESVRNVYWLQERAVFTNINRNLGWYSPLAVTYNIFGFTLFTAKYFRLVLDLIALLCIASLLKKYLGIRNAWVPLITIGLSPTLLYFTMMAVPYGIDFQYLPITIYLLDKLNFKKNKMVFNPFEIMLWFITMIAWLSYPTFLYYIPFMFYFYANKLFNQINHVKTRSYHLALSMLGFLAPLILLRFYIRNDHGLFSGLGLFTGAGQASLDINGFISRILSILENLFLRSNGYHMEILKVEFSDFYPILTILAVIFMSFTLIARQKKLRPLIISLLLILIVNTIANGLIGEREGVTENSGLRRATPIISSFYFLYILVWNFVLKEKQKFQKAILVFLMVFIPIHHLVVYAANLSNLKNSSAFAEKIWFVRAESPGKSLNIFLDIVQREDLNISCFDEDKKPVSCRHDLIFSTVAGACTWNNLACHDINAYDPNLNVLKKITINSGI